MVPKVWGTHEQRLDPFLKKRFLEMESPLKQPTSKTWTDYAATVCSKEQDGNPLCCPLHS